MLSKKLLVFIFFVSFLISCLLLTSKIDQDFYAYYYIGQGVFEGKSLYRDLAEVKGPMHHLFFTGMYAIFQSHYVPAIVITSALLDGVVVCLLLLTVSKDLNLKQDHVLFRWWNILFLITLYKSFSFFGGIYAENVSLLFLLSAIFLWQKGLKLGSGVLFGLSILTRLSIATFILYFIASWLLERRRWIDVVTFLAGLAIPVVSFSAWFYLSGLMGDFFYYTVIWVIKYGQTELCEKE